MSPRKTSRFTVVNAFISIIAFLFLVSCEKERFPVCYGYDDYLDCPELKISRIDFDASWSPNGDSLVFAHSLASKPESSGIYIIDSAGRSKRFVYWDPAVQSTRWSPKGDWIVFHSSARIYKVKTNGDSLTQLTFSGSNFFPDWSPNGNRIIYDRTDSAFGIWIMNTDGSDKRWIVRGRHPSFSPDGSKIIYVNGIQLNIVDTTGSNVVELTSFTDGSGTKFPSFSPGVNNFPPLGNRIVFQYVSGLERPNVWVTDLRGTNLQKLTDKGGYSPRWSPDGSRISYCKLSFGNGRLWIMDAFGRNKKQITR